MGMWWHKGKPFKQHQYQQNNIRACEVFTGWGPLILTLPEPHVFDAIGAIFVSYQSLEVVAVTSHPHPVALKNTVTLMCW